MPRPLAPARGPLASLLLCAVYAGGARADEPPPLSAELIDREVEAALATAGLEPAPPADPATWLRRVWLDLLGTLPPPEQVERFLREDGPAERQALVERLLASPQAARRASAQWTAELFDGPARDAGLALLRQAFREWLASQLEADRPWDQVVAEVLAGEGRTDQDPALLWILERAGSADPADLAGPALRQFLGLQLECARCHDHPFQRWTQAEFHAATAWFARLRVRPEPGLVAVFRLNEGPVGEHRAAVGGDGKQEITPGFPAGLSPAPGDEAQGEPLLPGVTRTSRRLTFARWVTSPRNSWFARAAVNRVWARLCGAPLVSPVDDLEAAKLEGHAPLARLLERLAAAFAQDGFSLRRLTAAIVSSRAWQRSVQGGEQQGDERLRSVAGAARVRPLDAEALTGALLAAAGRDVPGPGEPARIHQALRARLEGELSGALPVAGAARDPDQVTTAQALTTLVGPALNGLVRGPLVSRALEVTGEEARLRRLWLLTLSRPPRAGELVHARAHVRRTKPEREAWEDLAWALVAGSEFHTNH